MLQKGVYPYEYMGKWEKFKKDICSHLNMEDIANADYAHAKKICKDSERKSF